MYLRNSKKLKFTPSVVKVVEVIAINCEKSPSENMNEAYTLTVDGSRASIIAEAEWGVLHALGTEFSFSIRVKRNFGTMFHFFTSFTDGPIS